MQLPTKNSKQKRTVKNALVNIENVTIQPGFNYRNWIALTQIKLKEREIELVKIRLQSVSDSISTSLLQFTSEISQIVQFEPQVHIPINDMEYSNYKAFGNAIRKTKLNTFKKSTWKGYKGKSRDDINTFQDYFKRGKSWWDLRKVDIIAKHILIPISDMINQFAQQAAKQFFANRFFRLQKLYT
eukprot:435099_1